MPAYVDTNDPANFAFPTMPHTASMMQGHACPRRGTMSDPYASLKAGTFTITAHDRIIFGTPAGEAVVAEAERSGARRVFVTSARSLAQKTDGPLQRLERALGSRHAGT